MLQIGVMCCCCAWELAKEIGLFDQMGFKNAPDKCAQSVWGSKCMPAAQAILLHCCSFEVETTTYPHSTVAQGLAFCLVLDSTVQIYSRNCDTFEKTWLSLCRRNQKESMFSTQAGILPQNYMPFFIMTVLDQRQDCAWHIFHHSQVRLRPSGSKCLIQTHAMRLLWMCWYISSQSLKILPFVAQCHLLPHALDRKV